MKRHLSRSRATATLLAAMSMAATGALPAATLYWDTDSGTAGVGGTGTWNTGNLFWNDASTGLGTVSDWNNASRNTADFRGTGGAVTVDADGVAADALVFAAGGYTLSGGTVTLGRAAGTGNYTMVNFSTGTAAVTVSSNLLLNDNYTTAARTYTFNNGSGQSLSLNGNLTVDFSSGPTGNTTLAFTTGSSTSSLTLGGQILKGTNGGTLALSFGTGSGPSNSVPTTNGTFYVAGDNSAVTAGANISGGTVIVSNGSALGTGTITFGSSGARGQMILLTDGALTVANSLNLSGATTSQTTVGGNTAHDSTFSGNFNMNAFASTPDPRLTASAGGRVNFSGNLTNTAATRGIEKVGAGIVALTRAAGNGYNGVTKVSQGTLLISNTSGSATGTSSVTVSSGATLAGTGFSTGAITASGATSRFSAGDMTKEGVSSIGNLSLTGGLVAASGATFAVDVNGASVDTINFGTGALDLDGTVTVDFTSLGTVQTGTAYSLFAGTGDWSSVSATFVINGPSGYTLDSSYGSGNGYIFDKDAHSFTVQFSAIPEPSTYALLAGGAGLMLVAGRRRRVE